MIEKRCNLERKVLANTLSIASHDPAKFVFHLKERPGFIGILGEVIHVSQFYAVVVSAREYTDCYNEFPVTYNREPKFLRPRTKILTNIG